MAKGRSFFERLTGSIALNGDDDFEEVEEHPEDVNQNEWKPEESPEEAQLSVDVYQTPEEIVIQTIVAGVRPEDLQISITREMVTIKGHREKEAKGGEDYFQQELFWGPFTRTILLPSEVETEESDATEKHGLLTIKLPKIDKNKTQKLKVKSV